MYTEWLSSDMAYGSWLYLQSLFSGRRRTDGWTHLHDTDLWQELNLLPYFMTLGISVMCFGKGWAWGEVWHSVDRSHSHLSLPLFMYN